MDFLYDRRKRVLALPLSHEKPSSIERGGRKRLKVKDCGIKTERKFLT
jgi:hypothetical protein